ncbi:MAG: ATP-dependent endonuclease [Candidatus Gastranaerophilales bacterium]|nr:ATP-dependent endonuclease [Candidatus Gastranaerophilales bacterium]
MSSLKKNEIKYKLLTFDEMVINLDRLSRFKFPDDSFKRVFNSIIFKCLLNPKLSGEEIENLDSSYIADIVKLIWNDSVKFHFNDFKNNKTVNSALKCIIENSFKNISADTKRLMKANIYYSPILDNISYESASANLKFLIKVNETYRNTNITIFDLIKLREKYKLKFPITKLIIVEGITEEILLPVFANKLHHSFDREGIFIMGAGGKSKSPTLYMRLKNKLKIPVTLLFDSDAYEICDILKKNLLKKDNIYIIENGEFEDILSENLIKRALNKEYQLSDPLLKKDLHIYENMCDNIESFYKTRHLGEFKKSKLSKIIAENVKYNTDVTKDIKKIIEKII